MPALRRVLAALVALVVIAAGVFVVAQAVARLAGSDRPVWVNYNAALDQLAQRGVGEPVVLAVSGALVLVGLAVLVIAARTGPRPLSLTALGEQLRVIMPARHVSRVIEAAAEGVEGVTTATATTRRRRVRVRVTTSSPEDADLATRVREHVQRCLDALAPANRAPRVRVRLRHLGR